MEIKIYRYSSVDLKSYLMSLFENDFSSSKLRKLDRILYDAYKNDSNEHLRELVNEHKEYIVKFNVDGSLKFLKVDGGYSWLVLDKSNLRFKCDYDREWTILIDFGCV